MERIIFQTGKQKEFIDHVLEKVDSPSLINLLSFGISTNYSSLKNYYTERRALSKELFEELCELSKIDKSTLDYKTENPSWGQVKGGKISKRTKNLKVTKQ